MAAKDIWDRGALIASLAMFLVGCGASDEYVTAGANDQVRAVEACVAPPSGIVAWWPGDCSARDIVGDHHGSWDQFTDSLVAQAFTFAGTEDVARFPLEPIAGDFSVEFWVRADPGFDATVPTARVMFARGIDYTIGAANAGVDDAPCTACNGRLEVRGPMPRPYSLIDTWGVGAHGFRHVAVTYEAEEYLIYVDGLVQPGRALSDISVLNSPLEVTLGGHGASARAAFSGLLDEVTVYDRALTAAEIEDIAAARDAGKCKPADHRR
jgi:hypothetical protein